MDINLNLLVAFLLTVPTWKVASAKEHVTIIKRHVDLEGNTTVFDISRMEAFKERSIAVKRRGERRTPSIAGAQFLPDGRLLLSDIVNNKVKMLSSSIEYVDDVTVQEPKNIAVVNDTTVIVVSERTQLTFLSVGEELQIQSVIFTDQLAPDHVSSDYCFGIDVYDGTIYMSCYFLNTELYGYIRLLNMDGTPKGTLGVIDAQNFDFMFGGPYHVRVSRVSGNIFVTDWFKDTITRLSPSGWKIYEFSTDSLVSTQQFILDNHDNMLVCGADSNTLEIVKSNGRDHKVFLSAADGLSNPGSVAYRPSDGSLIVGSYYSNDIILFKLYNVQ